MQRHTKLTESKREELKKHLLTKPNAMGRILFALATPAMEKLLKRKCRFECELAATRLVVAIGQYRKAHGQLPLDLKALIPDSLQEIPLDPYDGAFFRYVPAKGLVYAVGENVIDEAGAAAFDPADSADPEPAPDMVYECKPK